MKRVVLPSGKTIEVVYFKDAAESPHEHSFREAAPAEPAHDLHVCPCCTSTLVYPTSWEEAGEDTWRVSLRCPECEHFRDGLFGEEAVEAFDEQLDVGTDSLVADYRRLMRANMEEEVELFMAALEAGAILPEDF